MTDIEDTVRSALVTVTGWIPSPIAQDAAFLAATVATDHLFKLRG